MITFPGTREHPRQRVDHSLDLAEVSSGRSMKDRVTIVEPCTDHRASHCPCSFIVDASPDMTQSSNAEVSSFANIVDLAVERQSFIKCDSKALDCFRNSNRSVAESHRNDIPPSFRFLALVPITMTSDLCGLRARPFSAVDDKIRYEKSFVSAPLQINIHYERAAQLAVKRVPERNIYRRNKGSRN